MLKLIAFDADDLAVLSANLQDAVLAVGDMTFLARERRFVALVNRFNWKQALDQQRRPVTYERRRSALRFERVLGAKVLGLDLSAKRAVLSLLALEFEPATELPEGHITLHLAGGGAIRLHVECIEAELRDLGSAWETTRRPEHEDGTPGAGEEPAKT